MSSDKIRAAEISTLFQKDAQFKVERLFDVRHDSLAAFAPSCGHSCTSASGSGTSPTDANALYCNRQLISRQPASMSLAPPACTFANSAIACKLFPAWVASPADASRRSSEQSRAHLALDEQIAANCASRRIGQIFRLVLVTMRCFVCLQSRIRIV